MTKIVGHVVSMAMAFGFGHFATADMHGKMQGEVKAQAIQFEKGSSQLTQEHKESIRRVTDEIAKKGGEMKLGIAAWSDQPFPGKQGELSDDQKELAEARLSAVEDYLDSLDLQNVNIDTYNMAEKANWLANLFNTESNELKSVFAKEDVNEDTLKRQYQAYKNNGQPGRVVMVLSRKK